MRAPRFSSPLFWIIAVVLIAGGVAAWRNNAAKPVQQAPASIASIDMLPTDVTVASKQDLRRILPLTGSVQAVRQASVKARVGGEIREVLVREGDAVKANQVVARMDESEYRARLTQARGALAAAQGQLDIAIAARNNNRALLDKGFISKNAFETTTSQYAIALANVESAKGALDVAAKALRDTTLTAPISGLVSRRSVEPGEKVSPDNPLLEIVDLDQLELAAAVPAADIGSVAVGQEVAVRVEGNSQRLAGRIVRINPATEAGSRSVPVYIRIDNPEGLLRSGMFAEAQLTLSRKDGVLAVPQSAVRTQGDGTYVYAVQNGKLVQRALVTGVTGATADGPAVEVLSGIEAGTQVVRSNLGDLPAGALVRITGAQTAPQATRQ